MVTAIAGAPAVAGYVRGVDESQGQGVAVDRSDASKLDCKHSWRELSNYLDGEISAELRVEVEAHVAQCRHCAALLDSAHNVVVLIADERRIADRF